MANIKISDLTSATSVADANEFEINEAGTSKKVSASQIQAYIESNLTTGSILLKGDGSGGVASATTDNGTSGQYLKTNGDGTFAWETLSSDPTMGGDLSGTASNAQIVAGAVGTTELASSSVTVAKISATGTPSSTTYLRGDGTWATAGGSSTSLYAVGTYTVGKTANNVMYTAGQTRSGSGLYSGWSHSRLMEGQWQWWGPSGHGAIGQQSVGSGSWRAMAPNVRYAAVYYAPTIWVRYA